jgi:hypothetical protein
MRFTRVPKRCQLPVSNYRGDRVRLVDTARVIPLDSRQLTVDQRAAGLRAWAAGAWGIEAAVELLIRHGYWLRDDDFLHTAAQCPQADHDHADVEAAPFMGIDWKLAAAFTEASGVASPRDMAMLRLAISLASHRQPVALAAELAGLDDANIRLVMTAIGHAAGWHARGITALIDGRF